MKKLLIVLIISLFMFGCASEKKIDGITYETYGFLNKDEVRNEDIHYEVSVGNLVLGCIFFETVIVPVYVFGFDLYEPIERR